MAGNQRLDVREYIGARYVPMFYDDGTGSAEWSSAAEYEPLTIVLHEGNSYTSRQYVPQGVAITNTAYWLETGNWNSQIEEYRREVLGFSDRITSAQEAATAAGTAASNAQSTADGAVSVNTQQTANIASLTARVVDLEARPVSAEKLKNRNLIFVGDSYQVGTTQGGTTTSFLDRIIGWKLLNPGHYWRVEAGGAGFTRENNFLAMLQSVVAGLSSNERDSVTDVVVTGCYNDASSTNAAIVQAITNFCNYCNTYLKNAKVTLIPAGWRRFGGSAGQTFPNLYNSVNAWYNGATQNGAGFSPGAHSMLARMPMYISSDGIHPTTDGYTELARVVVNALTGGDDTFKIQNTVTLQGVAPAINGSTLQGDWYVLPRGNDVIYTTASQFSCSYANLSSANKPLISGRGGFLPIAAAGPWPFVFPNGHFVGHQAVVLVGFTSDSAPQTFVSASGDWTVNADGVLGLSIVHGFASDGAFGEFRVAQVYSNIASFGVYS